MKPPRQGGLEVKRVMTMQSFIRISDSASVIGGDHWWIDNRVLNYLTPSECRLASANNSDPPAPRRSSTVTLRETVTCAAFDSERRQAATLSRRAKQSSTDDGAAQFLTLTLRHPLSSCLRMKKRRRESTPPLHCLTKPRRLSRSECA